MIAQTAAKVDLEEVQGLRLLESEKRILGQVVAGVPLSKVLEELVLAVEAETNGQMQGSILLLDRDGKHLLHGAAPNLPRAYNEAVDGIEIGEGAGSCGTAAHRGSAVYVTDIANDPLWARYLDLTLVHGLRACWSTPIIGADGRLLGTFGNYYREPRSPTPHDLRVIALVTQTAAVAIERHLSDQALKESEERFRTLVEMSPQVVWFCDANGEMTYCNPFWYLFTGLTLERTRNGGWASVIHPDDRDRARAVWQSAIDNVTSFQAEIRFKRASDSQYRCFDVRGAPVRDAEGQVARWIGIALDVHERKQAEEARELLTAELSHRIKNFFAIVGSLATISSRGHPAAEVFAREFRERLIALSKAHDYVRPLGASSNGAATKTMQGLIGDVLAPYAERFKERFKLSGDDVSVGTGAATALALVIHEQATNAVKYGALSGEGGTVQIEGQRTDSAYSLTWRESGGPLIAGPPERRGFGTAMADRSITDQLGGTIEHIWAAGGLTTRVQVPLVSLAR